MSQTQDPPKEHVLKWDRSEQIMVPAPDQESRLGIRRADWNRINRCLNQIPRSNNRIQIAYATLFGVSGSCAVTVLPLWYSSNLPPWIVPFYVLATIFSFITGVVLVCVDKRLVKQEVDHIENIQKDIEEIEKTFTSR